MSTRRGFRYETLAIRDPALSLDYYPVPWDSTILGVPVAQIATLQVIDARRATDAFGVFRAWCSEQQVALCAARLPATSMAEVGFLEQHGFRFIELNYQPTVSRLELRSFPPPAVRVLPAEPRDRPILRELAKTVFRHGRFHQDPLIDPALGDRRYGVWLENAFEQPHQTVVKCVLDDEIVGFFVVEAPEPTVRHWSLNALAQKRQGSGFGQRVWQAMLDSHRAEGVRTVSTSISSHNVAALNLYVSLGFRFPAPSVTLHWCPRGRIMAEPQP
jgi:ribosomal protein S18 acetylase RimI-like enzyme